METIPLVPCSKCGTQHLRTLEFFRPGRTCLDGISRVCRTCDRAYFNRYRAEHLEKEREKGRRYEAANPEKRRAKDRAYYANNVEKVAQKNKGYHERNRERIGAMTAEWQRRNPGRVHLIKANRRARKLSAEGHFTKKDVLKQYEAQGRSCFYCDKSLQPPGSGEVHADHFIPLSRGGSNWPTNIVCACETCNLSKHDKMPWQFMPERFSAPEGWVPEFRVYATPSVAKRTTTRLARGWWKEDRPVLTGQGGEKSTV